MIHTYLTLLIALIPITLLGAFFGGSFQSTKKRSFLYAALIVPLTLALMSGLLMNSQGKPLIEWLLPIVCVVFAWLTYRSGKLFLCIAVISSIIACLCSYLFIMLIASEYMVNIHRASARHSIQEIQQLNHVFDSLVSEYGADAVIEPSEIDPAKLPDGHQVEKIRYTSEWHTFFTRLYRVEYQNAVIVYPGGKVAESREKLKLKIE